MKLFSILITAQQSERNRTALIEKRTKSPSLTRSLSPGKAGNTLHTSRKFDKKLNKHELFDFYIQILQNVEKVKFNVNVPGAEENMHSDLSLEYIINFEEVTVEEKEREIFNILTSKYGKQFFCILFIDFIIFNKF